MMIIFLIGGLLLLGISLMVLDAAIEQAEDGYEDALGFHQESHHRWSRHASSSSSSGELTPWDRAEGAACPLDPGPSFRPIGNSTLTPQGR